jgi:CBS domain-containing protein
MNVAFFLTPKVEVAWLPVRATVRQALEKMEHHRYSAIPLLDEDGRYVGTLTEGDLLFRLRDSPTTADRIPLVDVPRRLSVHPVSVTADIEDLFLLAVEQNFVPVVDSRGVFMGIVRRKVIIEYLIKEWQERAV